MAKFKVNLIEGLILDLSINLLHWKQKEPYSVKPLYSNLPFHILY